VADNDLQRIFDALATASVRYIVVGGVAVVLHGYPRLTADLDLVVALQPANVQAALSALAALGYRPRAPVVAEDFAKEDIRRQWIEEKGLKVFTLWSPSAPLTEVDLFVEEPFPFDEAYSRGVPVTLGSTRIFVACSQTEMAEKRPDNGWRQHSEDQLRAWLATTPEQRIQWLEQAKRFCQSALGAASRKPSST
jgi:hypothetical protein